MKQTISFLLFLTSITFLFTSCEKNKQGDINTDEVRLQAIEIKQSNGDINKLIFDYDANGRIDKISSGRNNETPTPSFIIKYSDNEVLITPFTVVDNANATMKDTVRLLLNAEQRITKRIYHSFNEFKASHSQRTNIYDTSTYSYDAAGRVTQQIHGALDTTWYNPGIKTTIVSRTVGLTDYTITDGNVVSSKKVVTTSTYTRQGGFVSESRDSTETNHLFEYAKAYPNKTDFQNAAILNELQLVFPQLNRNLRNVPEKILVTDVTRDRNGNITSSKSYTINQQFSYNTYGFINTRFDLAHPTLKTTYVYNK